MIETMPASSKISDMMKTSGIISDDIYCHTGHSIVEIPSLRADMPHQIVMT